MAARCSADLQDHPMAVYAGAECATKFAKCQVLAKAVQLHRISSRISMFAFVRNDGAAEADSFALVRCWRGQSDGTANTKF